MSNSTPLNCPQALRYVRFRHDMSKMAFSKIRTTIFQRAQLKSKACNYTCSSCRYAQSSLRKFTTSPHFYRDANSKDEGPFGTRLRAALRRTKVEWKPIPVGLGIAFLGAAQFYRVREREKRRQAEEGDAVSDNRDEEGIAKPRKRKRIRPSGPW